MLSSAPMLIGLASIVAFVLTLSACTLPAPDSEGDLYVSSSVSLQRTASLDNRIDASCLGFGYSLAYQIAEAMVVVRARLVSVTTGVEIWDSVDDIREAFGTPDEITYVGTLEYTFAVVEYLKGTGGDEIVAVVVADNASDHLRREEAEQDALWLLDDRDKRWDGREAILFLNAADSHFVEFPEDDRYMLGSVSLRVLGCGGGYTISSQHDKMWLPAASAALGASTAGGSGRFLLDYPKRSRLIDVFDYLQLKETVPVPVVRLFENRPAPSLTLSKLKTMIKIVERCSLPNEHRRFSDCIGKGYAWYPLWSYSDW